MTLVNAHTHLEFSALGHLLPARDSSFPDWLGTAGKSLHGRRDDWFRQACEKGIRLLHDAGTTHVGDISWSGASVVPLARSGLRGIVWLEMRGVVRSHGHERLAWLRREMDRLRGAVAGSPIRLGVEIHAPYSLHPAFWEPVLRWIEDQQLPLCIHAAESPSEWQLFTEGGGDLAWFEATMAMSHVPDWLRSTAVTASLAVRRWFRPRKRTLNSPPRTTPVAYLERMGALQFAPWLVHMVHVSDEDIRRVRCSGSVVVHCPRSNQRLRCGRMPLEKLLAAGVPVLLGTDSLASSPTLDVRDEVVAAKRIHSEFIQPEEIDALVHHSQIFERLDRDRARTRCPVKPAPVSK